MGNLWLATRLLLCIHLTLYVCKHFLDSVVSNATAQALLIYACVLQRLACKFVSLFLFSFYSFIYRRQKAGFIDYCTFTILLIYIHTFLPVEPGERRISTGQLFYILWLSFAPPKQKKSSTIYNENSLLISPLFSLNIDQHLFMGLHLYACKRIKASVCRCAAARVCIINK